MVKTLYLIRHGETGHVKQGRFFGATDLPLSEEGRQQALALRPWLAGKTGPNSGCLASPQLRALETAALAWPGISPEQVPDLREINFGEAEGLSFGEIQDRFPEVARQWAEFHPDLCFPGGESLRDYQARVRRMAQRLATDSRETLAVFSHGGIIRSLVCEFLGLPGTAYASFVLPCAGVAVVKVSGNHGALAGLGPIP